MIRGLALGTLNERTRVQFLLRELKMAGALSVILAAAGFARAILFKTGIAEAIAVTAALAMIVFSSVCLGAILPLILEYLGVDPAHSSTTIQGKCRYVVSFYVLGLFVVAIIIFHSLMVSSFQSDHGHTWSHTGSSCITGYS